MDIKVIKEKVFSLPVAVAILVVSIMGFIFILNNQAGSAMEARYTGKLYGASFYIPLFMFMASAGFGTFATIKATKK